MPDRSAKALKTARDLQRSFGNAIRDARKTQGLTQEQLAERAGLSLNYVGNLERGEKMASLETVVRVAEAMHMSGAELLRAAGI